MTLRSVIWNPHATAREARRMDAQPSSASREPKFFGPDVWIMTGLVVPNVLSLVSTATRFRTTRREV
jgi:hypothetical protein